MIRYDVAQGSDAWGILRMGRPTSSDFDKLITPKTGQLSAQATAYADKLLAEIVMMEPLRTIEPTYWMERGNIMEGRARDAYQMIYDVDLEHGGFITDDQGHYGSSPDALIVATNGGLEIKCPAPHTHMGYLLRGASTLEKYKAQYQGQMLICELDYVDVLSYHPDLPPAVIRMTPDLEYQAKMKEALQALREDMNAQIERLIAQGHLKIEDYDKKLSEVGAVHNINGAPVETVAGVG